MSTVLEACDGLPVTTLEPGAVILREGERTGRLYVLIEGTLGVLKNGVEVARAATPGAMFGEMSVLLDLPHSATVYAATDARMHVVEDGETFLANTPGIALHAARTLARRLHDSTTYLADLKAQYQGTPGHFGMIDRILDSLMNKPGETAKGGAKAKAGDSRL